MKYMKPERSLIWQKRELVGSSGLSARACRQFERNIKGPKRGRISGLDRRGLDALRLAIWCPTGPGLHAHRVVNSARLSRSISHGPHCLASNACVNILRNETTVLHCRIQASSANRVASQDCSRGVTNIWDGVRQNQLNLNLEAPKYIPLSYHHKPRFHKHQFL